MNELKVKSNVLDLTLSLSIRVGRSTFTFEYVPFPSLTGTGPGEIFVCLFVLQARISLCSHGCSGTEAAVQAGLTQRSAYLHLQGVGIIGVSHNQLASKEKTLI